MRMMTRREAIVNFGVVTGALVISECSVNPATGKRNFILLSPSDEIALGKESYPQIVSVYGIFENTGLQNYLRTIGQRVVRAAPSGAYDFTFTLLDDSAVNAMAAPGGYVYFTRGIMAYLNDTAQLAGVMAHEVTHVVARHYAQQYSRAEAAQLGIGLGGLFIERVRDFGSLINLGTQLLFLKYSRDAESEADDYGVRYMSAAGYDGVRLSSFFGTLKRLQGSTGGLPTWESTHPDPGSRERKVRNEALKIQKEHPSTSYTIGRNDYIQLLDGLVFGEDPRGGFVKNGVFYHPGLRFSFPVPPGWTLANQASEVRMSPQDQSALLIFRSAEGQDPRTAAEQFASSNSIKTQQAGAVTVNGMNGYRIIGTVTSGGQELDVSSTVVNLSGSLYAFHGISSPDKFDGYTNTFNRTSGGLSRVTAAQYLNVSPRRIDVRTVSGSKTLDQALGGFGVPSGQRGEAAILNGMNLTDQVTGGTRIKVIA